MTMLHHISLPVADLQRAAALYDAALSALGYRRVCSGDDFAGYGVEDDKDKFSI
jgi:catechol 2,3-dioxygenase-like lactoylglutathione lyase family enzyme